MFSHYPQIAAASSSKLALYARLLGIEFLVLAVAMIPSLLVSLHFRDGAQFALLIAAVGFLFLGLLLRNILGRNAHYEIHERGAFWITAFAWIVLPLVGALPYLLSGELSSFSDAAFESMSGFTTTGSSVIAHPEQIPQGLLFYRSTTQWIGGLGFMLFLVAAFRRLKVGSIHLYEAEFSGGMQPKLHPRMSESVERMWRVYLLLTLLLFVALLLCGNGGFDAACIAFSTISTGGFMTHSLGMEDYNNASLLVVTCFMLLSGVNMALLYNLVTLRWHQFRGDEFRYYLYLFVVSVALVTVALVAVGNNLNVVCFSVFHVASTISTCGFYVAPPAHWSFGVSCLTFLLIFVGACSGSTGSGLKLKRIMILVRYVRNYFAKMMHPNAVFTVKVENEMIPESYIKKVLAFMFLYLCFVGGGAFLITLGGEDIPEAVCLAAANMGNLGPSPLMDNLGLDLDYALLPKFSKWVLMLLMLAGRIEIFALLAMVSPSYYKRRK